MTLPNYSSADLAQLPRWEKIALLERLGKSTPANDPADLTRYRDDPVGFCREVLGVEPWERQREIMQAVAEHSRVTVRACHNSGKSWLAGCLIHWWVRCFTPSLVVTTAGNVRQVRDVLWQEVQNRQIQAKLPGSLSQLKLEVSPSQRAYGFSTNEPVRFQGWHEANILIIVDEASGVEEPIWEALEGCLTGPNAHLLVIGNPNSPSGSFYTSHTSALYQPFHIAAADVPPWLLPPGWAEERRQEWGEDNPAYQVRVLGEFPDQGDDSLIAMRWVTSAQERSLEATGPVEIGVDVARYGSDETCLYVRQGPVVLTREQWRGQDTVATANRTAALAKEHGATVIKVDDIGVGGGVTDQLQATFRDDRRVTVIGVNVGNTALDSEGYFNRRSELYAGLAQRFKDGSISLPGEDAALLGQLCALKKQYTPKGQMKLESKDDMRKRLPKMGSPDRAEALMLAFSTAGNRWQPYSGLGETRDF